MQGFCRTCRPTALRFLTADGKRLRQDVAHIPLVGTLQPHAMLSELQTKGNYLLKVRQKENVRARTGLHH